GGRPMARAHVADEGHASIGAAPSGQGSGIAHEGMLAKGCFHSFEIDAGAPNFDLPILAAHPFQQSVGSLAHQISRPEESRRGGAVAFNAAGGAMSLDP